MRRFDPAFVLPAAVAILMACAFIFSIPFLFLAATALGIGELAVKAYRDLMRKNWALDYIAFLAMVVALASGEWVAGSVIALMYTGGSALEVYASRRATAALASLLTRIPKTVLMKVDGREVETPLTNVPANAIIRVRGNELVPLDGYLVSGRAVLTLANLTGEPLPETVTTGSFIKSGSVNAGEAFELRVSGTLATSTYAKIVDLVREAEQARAPFARLAARANIPFTILTLVIAAAAHLVSGDITRILAVLVIATPCPLIIAAPVAFIGALSRAASRNIIVKTPAALEAVARATTIFFDKTGTLTLGEPHLTDIVHLTQGVNDMQVLSLAAALEFHSIHPLARAIITAARAYHFTPAPAHEVREVTGDGITGMLEGHYLVLEQAPKEYRRAGSISLMLKRDGVPVAVLHFADVLKQDARKVLTDLKAMGYKVAILTGDSAENARAIFAGFEVDVRADCTPEEKHRIVAEAKRRGETVAMVGDGLNDAPALVTADVGIVFSGTENSASIEAADIAVLGHDAALIRELFTLSHRSVRIAGESVYVGIGLSVIGMVIAALGFIAPIEGAIIQEGIDVAVIVNALRTAFKARA